MSSQPKVILITGASSGIGRTCAIALSKAFSPLVLVLSGRREDELQKTAEACKEGTTTEICVGDVSDDACVEEMFKTVKEKYGRLDLLFNNAGVDLAPGKPLIETDMAVFRRMLEINIMAAVLVGTRKRLERSIYGAS